jgi:hypothetical protein
VQAGVLELLPGYRRKDPRIRTQTYRQADAIRLEERTIGIRPFEIPQAGKPVPPDFAPFLGQALTWAFPDSVVDLDPGSAGEVEVLIEGRMDLFHRVGAQGLRVAVSVVVYDVSAGEPFVLWHGAKKADWIRRFSTDDCLLALADDFVATWRD